MKVKHRDAFDVVCGAVVGPLRAPTILVVGLPVEGDLTIVGRTVPLSKLAVTSLVPLLRPPVAEHPWSVSVPASTVNGFGSNREVVTLTLVDPFVVEVTADVAWTGRSFRRPLRFVRSRPALDPSDVTTPTHLPSPTPG